jgi:hypothetical protein
LANRAKFDKPPHVLLESIRRRKWALAYLVVVVSLSTLIFSHVEGHSLFDAFYWTITVLSTVGFGDITPHTAIGKTLFIFDAISGITTYIYLITSWQASLIEARLERQLWKVAERETRRNEEQ